MDRHKLLNIFKDFPRLYYIFEKTNVWQGPRNPNNESWEMDQVFDHIEVVRLDLEILGEEGFCLIDENGDKRTSISHFTFVVTGENITQISAPDMAKFRTKLRSFGSAYFVSVAEPLGRLLRQHTKLDYVVIVHIEENEYLPDGYERKVNVGVLRPPNDKELFELLVEFELSLGDEEES